MPAAADARRGRRGQGATNVVVGIAYKRIARAPKSNGRAAAAAALALIQFGPFLIPVSARHPLVEFVIARAPLSLSVFSLRSRSFTISHLISYFSLALVLSSSSSYSFLLSFLSFYFPALIYLDLLTLSLSLSLSCCTSVTMSSAFSLSSYRSRVAPDQEENEATSSSSCSAES